MKFEKWLDVFLSEKGIDLEEIIVVDGPSGENHLPVACLVELMKRAPEHERKGLKVMMVKLDFLNAPIRPYLAHLAKAVAI